MGSWDAERQHTLKDHAQPCSGYVGFVVQEAITTVENERCVAGLAIK